MFKKLLDSLSKYHESLEEILNFIGYGSKEFFELELYLDYKWYVVGDEIYFYYEDLYINTISSYSAKGEKLFMNSDEKYTYIMCYDDNYGYDSATILIFDNDKEDEEILDF